MLVAPTQLLRVVKMHVVKMHVAKMRVVKMHVVKMHVAKMHVAKMQAHKALTLGIWSCKVTVVHISACCFVRVGQNRTDTPYMTV